MRIPHILTANITGVTAQVLARLAEFLLSGEDYGGRMSLPRKLLYKGLQHFQDDFTQIQGDLNAHSSPVIAYADSKPLGEEAN